VSSLVAGTGKGKQKEDVWLWQGVGIENPPKKKKENHQKPIGCVVLKKGRGGGRKS